MKGCYKYLIGGHI